MSRRDFIRASASMAALPLAGCLHSNPPLHPSILDTHTHFYDPQRPGGVPWPPANDPLLHRSTLPPDFIRIARPLGITGTVVVEASTLESDNDWLLDRMPGQPFLRGVVGHLKPGQPGFAQHLERLRQHPGFRGIRTGTWDGPVDVRRTGFLPDCQRLSDANLTLDVLVDTRGLAQVSAIADAVPGLRIVINHCANVGIDGKAPPAEWLRAMDAFTGRPRIHCKVSGLVEGTGRTDGSAPADPAFYAPTWDALWERFGSGRLIFGSNWPVSARFAPLERVVAIARELLATKSPDDAERVLRTNAEGIYRV